MKYFFLFFYFFIFLFLSAAKTKSKTKNKKKIKVNYSAKRIIYQRKRQILSLVGDAVLNVKNYQFTGKKIIVNKKKKITYCFGNSKIINQTNSEIYKSEIIIFDSKAKKIYGFLNFKDKKYSMEEKLIDKTITNSYIEKDNLKVTSGSFALQLNGEKSFFTNNVKIISTEETKEDEKKTILKSDLAFYNSKVDQIELTAYSNQTTETVTDGYYILSSKANLIFDKEFNFNKNVKLYSFKDNKTNLTIFGNKLQIVKYQTLTNFVLLTNNNVIVTNDIITTNEIVKCHTNIIFHDLKEDNKIFSDYLEYNAEKKDFYFSKNPILINKKKDFSIAANELDGNTEKEIMYGKGDVFLTNINSVVSGIILKYEDKENLWVSGNVFIDKDKGKEKFSCEKVRYEIDTKKVNMIGNVRAIIDNLEE